MDWSVQQLSTGWTVRGGIRDLLFSTPVQSNPAGHTTFCTVDTVFLSRGINQPARGVVHLLYHATKLRMSGVIPSLSFCAYMACDGETFTFTSTNKLVVEVIQCVGRDILIRKPTLKQISLPPS